MFKFIHAADIHLDSPLKGLERYEGAPVDEIREATRRALANLVQLALDEEVAFVLIAGDLYDGAWRDYNTGLWFVKQMSRLRDAKIPVFLVAGNHDAENKMTKRLRMPGNVAWLSASQAETRSIEALNVAIHGRGFKTQAVSEDLAATYPDAIPGAFNIGLLHTSGTGSEGHENYAPCSTDTLLSKGYDYWALGHIHKRQILHENPVIAFSGNTQGRHIHEAGPKGCLLVSVDDRHAVVLEFRALDVLRWECCVIDAAALDTPHDVLVAFRDRLEHLLRENGDRVLAVRVVIEGVSPAHDALAAASERFVNDIRAAAIDFGGDQVWVEKVKVATKPLSVDLEQESGGGPVGELLGLFRELESTPELLAELSEELVDVEDKLPADLREGGGALRLREPDVLRALLQEVQPMLLSRLRRGGTTP